MCGIVGIIGKQDVASLLVEGLKRLEYRGYDSAGLAVFNGGQLEIRNIRSARERVLSHLFLAAGADSRTVRLDGTLMDLAGEIGLSHEVLYRTLAALEAEGLIARTRSTLTLKMDRRV